MLSRAVSTHASSNRPKVQQPLALNNSATNVQRQAHNGPIKRKFDRSISNTSSLGALHQNVYFNENDFDDDLTIDLTNSPPPKPSDISYPSLPPLSNSPNPSQKLPASSAPVDWSSSPLDHYRKPLAEPGPVSVALKEEQPLKKRKILPWEQEKCVELQASIDLRHAAPNQSTPAADVKRNTQKYFWEKTASAVKEEQKEMRKKNATKQTALKLKPADGASAPMKIATTHLSDEQRHVAKTVVEDGKSVFFTGSAGTGKSVLMRSIISQLRAKYRREPDRLAITASTGLAACVIEGTTLHSWAGIGLGKEPAPELVKKIKRNAKTRSKWMRTKILIIDEISMVDGELFDKLEQIARMLRNNGRPFGGIQLIVTGDFFQLPPVPERNGTAKFAFDSATWATCIEHTILLTHVFRQKDPTFANMLNEMRLGKLSQNSINEFKKLSRPLDKDDVEATELFPTRTEVDNANNGRMQRLVGELMIYEATDTGHQDLNVRNKMLANFLAPERLALKKGAQVMLIKNIDSQLVNGTLGRVLCFMDEATWATYKEDEVTYREAYRDEQDEDTEKAKVKFDAQRFKNQQPGAATRFWPMVRFPLADGTVREMLCIPEEWKTESQTGEIIAKRSQVPLILAWALSIHKAQGQTLSRVKVDLGRVFERGQAYVALSRATSQAGLQVLRFDAKKVMVHPRVISFYQKLSSIHDVTAKSSKHASMKQQAADEFDEEEELYMLGKG